MFIKILSILLLAFMNIARQSEDTKWDNECLEHTVKPSLYKPLLGGKSVNEIGGLIKFKLFYISLPFEHGILLIK